MKRFPRIGQWFELSRVNRPRKLKRRIRPEARLFLESLEDRTLLSGPAAAAYLPDSPPLPWILGVNAHIQTSFTNSQGADQMDAVSATDAHSVTNPNNVYLAAVANSGAVQSSPAPTTSTFAGPTSLDPNGAFAGLYLIFTSGANQGLSEPINTYTGSTRTFTFAPGFTWPNIVRAGDTFDLQVGSRLSYVFQTPSTVLGDQPSSIPSSATAISTYYFPGGSTLSGVDDAYDGQTLSWGSGAANQGQPAHVIVGYIGSLHRFLFATPWPNTPNAGDSFTVQTPTAPTTTSFAGTAPLSPNVGAYAGQWLTFTTGSNAGQSKQIQSYTGSTPPAAPGLSQTSGGTLPATTYYVKVAYVYGGPTGSASAESSLAVSANKLLQVSSPTSVPGATGYNVYAATTTGNEVLQNSSPVALGTTWTEPTMGLVTGPTVPGVHTFTFATGWNSAPNPSDSFYISNYSVVTLDPSKPLAYSTTYKVVIQGGTAAPALSQISGGSLPATTYYVKVAYVYGSSTGPGSAESSLAVSANKLLQVSSPTSVTGATGYNVYAATASGNEQLQNASPLALGTTWTEPTTGLVTGTASAPAVLGVQDNSGNPLANPSSGSQFVWQFTTAAPPQNGISGTAPALSQTSGGTLPATTYYVKVAYVYGSLAGPGSAESSLAVSANNLLQVSSPASVPGATGYNVYAATASGNEQLQNTSPVALGTTWTEPTTGLVTGNVPATQPILVVTSTSNPFTTYYPEILRAEGFNEFATADISSITLQSLSGYSVVILGDMSLASYPTQLSNLITWANGGGNVIVMHPDRTQSSLLNLLGLTHPFSLSLNGNPTGGNFTLIVDGHATQAIAWNASAAAIQSALAAAAPSENPAVSGGPLPGAVQVLMSSATATLQVGQNNLTGGTNPQVSITLPILPLATQADPNSNQGAYLQINTGYLDPNDNPPTILSPGAGLTTQPIQYHGPADEYVLGSGTYSVANLAEIQSSVLANNPSSVQLNSSYVLGNTPTPTSTVDGTRLAPSVYYFWSSGSSLSNVDGAYNGLTLTFTTGAANAGQSRTISSYTASTHAFGFQSAWSTAPNGNDQFWISSSSVLTTTISTVFGPSPSTTSFSGAPTLSSTDGAYNGLTLTFTRGANNGSQQILNYIGSTHTFTFSSPWANAPGLGDAFSISFSSSTTSFSAVGPALSSANGAYNNQNLYFITGANAGPTPRTISNYLGPSHTFIFAQSQGQAWTYTPAAGDAFSFGSTATSFIAAAPGLSTVDNAYNGLTLTFTSGANANLSNVISGYTGASHQFTFASAWPNTPGAGDAFNISISLNSFSGASSSLSPVDGAYNGQTLTFTSGQYNGASNQISSYTGASRTFTFNGSWMNLPNPPPSSPPSQGDTFNVSATPNVFSAAGANLSQTDRTYVGQSLVFTSGLNAGQSPQLITGYVGFSHTFSFAAPWTYTPQAGDSFYITGAAGTPATVGNPPFPAVTWRNLGPSGGIVAAFTFDLAKSIIYLRQGNPDYQKQDILGQGGIAANEFFARNFLDASKPLVPQADEEQRLLVNIIEQMELSNSSNHATYNMPLPRFWYFPGKTDGSSNPTLLKALVVETGDDHVTPLNPNPDPTGYYSGGTGGRWDMYLTTNSPLAGQSPGTSGGVPIRGTSYIYSPWLEGAPYLSSGFNPFLDQYAQFYTALGFEAGNHFDSAWPQSDPLLGFAYLGNYPTPAGYSWGWLSKAQLESFYDNQFYAWDYMFPNIPTPSTNRTHGTTNTDYDSQAQAEFDHRIRLDENYSSWGLGAGFLPARFYGTDIGSGAVIDTYQAPNFPSDFGGAPEPNNMNSYLDDAVGPLGYYGVFSVNDHSDDNITGSVYPGLSWRAYISSQIVNSAQNHNVPVISASHLLKWLDGRNNSSFSSTSWNSSTLKLTFTINAAVGSQSLESQTLDGTTPWTLQVLIPVHANVGGTPKQLSSITGPSANHTLVTIKGVEYWLVQGQSGTYTATYGASTAAPNISSIIVSPLSKTSVTISWTTDVGSSSTVSITGGPSVTNYALVIAHSITITGLTPLTTYSYTVSSTSFVPPGTPFSQGPKTTSSTLTFQTNINPANETTPPPSPPYTNLFNTDIVGLTGNQWWVGLSNGSSFQNAFWGYTPNLPTGVTWQNFQGSRQVADFNGDGKADVAALDSAGNWWIQLSNGHNAFQYADVTTLASSIPEPWNRFFGTWPTNVTWKLIATGDFRGDGLPSIVGFGSDGKWYVLDSYASFASPSSGAWAQWSTAVAWVDPQVGDFDGDGTMDVAARIANGYLGAGQWWVGLSNGTSFVTTLWTAWATGATWVDVHVGDFNGDGKTDIVGRWLEAGQWWVGLSTGSSFTNSLWTTWSASVTWTNVMVGDFNGDGKADIVGYEANPATGQWWAGVSTGSSFTNALWDTWDPSVFWTSGNSAGNGYLGDFNGDGLMDIAGFDPATGKWRVGISTGSSFTSSYWTTWSTAVSWTFIQTGDVGT